jgi:hypothetical protein
MLKLDANALQVESFPAVEATDYDVFDTKSTPGPMCTCVSCTNGFPECDTPKCPPTQTSCVGGDA